MTFKKFQPMLRMYTCWETILDRQMDFASLVVQWLRLCLPIQGTRVQFLVGELRSHMPCGQNPKT